jgi:hypothetical protein
MRAKTHLSAAALLIIGLSPSRLQADTYSANVLALSPTTYLRLDEASTVSPTQAANLGTLGSAWNGYYSTYGGGVTNTTGSGGGAIAGNAGVDTTGFAVNLTDGAYAAHPTLFAEGNNAFSVSLWVKPTAFAGLDWSTFLSYGEGTEPNNIVLAENGAAGDGSIVISRYADNVITSSGILTAGSWNHIGLTWDGATMRLYINGTPDNTWTGILNSYTTYAWLGGFFTGANPYSGGLDEFAYWNGTALTGAQMQILAGIPVNYSYQTSPSSSYPDSTGNELQDGARASTGLFTDPKWVGFNLVENGGPAVVTFDLHQETHVNGLTLSYLAAGNEGIYPPESFSVSFSSDGVNFGPAQSFTTTAFERGAGISAPSSATRSLNGQGRYVRLSMTHGTGAGYNYDGPFLFVDEVQWVTSNSTKEIHIPLTSATYVHNTGNEPWATYPDTGGVELYDGSLAANVDYSDAAWTSWNLDTGGAPQVIFDFGGEIRFSQVGLRFLNWPGVGIAAPESISVSYSSDGVNFTGTQNFTTTATERDPSGVGAAGIGRVARNLSGTGRYLKFEATHAQAPAIPLIMIDELQFEGAVLLGIEKSGSNVVLRWASGTLEESADLISGFTALPSATSPHTVTPTGKHFYRVRYQ